MRRRELLRRRRKHAYNSVSERNPEAGNKGVYIGQRSRRRRPAVRALEPVEYR